MEENNKAKLGPGIIAVAIIQLIIYSLAILGIFIVFTLSDTIQQDNALIAQIGNISASRLLISLVLIVISILGIVMVLLKKTVGVYIYFICVAINEIFLFINSADIESILLNLILPVLMALFIYKRKEVFGFGESS
jgi:hypothetical protein